MTARQSYPTLTTRQIPALLAAFSHPDDEAFSVAGTLARCHRAGRRVALFTATDGEAGKVTGRAVRDRADAARVRREELLASAGVLGVDRIFTPGYPDGGLERVPADELIGRLVEVMREIRPDVVVTFGPEGAPTGHPDHKAVARLTTAAFFLAGIPTAFPGTGQPWRPARLYYHTWEGKIGRTGRGLSEGLEGCPITCRVDIGDVLDLKRASFAAHRSQQHHRPEFDALLVPVEEFHLAAGVPQPRPLTADLFEGLPAGQAD